jgi:sec-independent protein translocase protein TatA
MLIVTSEGRICMPGWFGPWEIAIVVVIILLVFGGKLIPRIGSSLGRSLVGLKKGVKEGEEGFKSAIKEDTKVDTKTDDGSAGTAPQGKNRADETATETQKTERG